MPKWSFMTVGMTCFVVLYVLFHFLSAEHASKRSQRKPPEEDRPPRPEDEPAP